MIRRARGAALGLGLGSLLPAALLLWLATEDPGFADHLPSLLACVFLPFQLVGVLLGGWLAPQGRAVLGVGLVALIAAGLSVRQAAREVASPPPVHPALLVIALPSVSRADLEATPMHTLLGLEAQGARLRFPELVGGLDDWITLDSGISTQGRPWTGERPTADQVPVARLWDIAAWSGLSVGLMGWPVTAPPRPLAAGGFVVPPGVAPSAWPEAAQAMPDLMRALLAPDETTPAPVPATLDLLPLGLRWSTLRDGALYVARRRVDPARWDLVLDRPLLRARLERDVVLALLRQERPDLAALVLSAPAAAGPLVRPWALAQADAILAEILSNLGDRTTVVVLSDRGWLIVAGPRVPVGSDLGVGVVEDIAPTLLGLLDLPVAMDQRGEALLGETSRRTATWDALAPLGPEGEHRRAAAVEALQALGYGD